jgi:hypothetical protein
VTSSGTINIAGAGSASQYINGALDLVTFPTVDNYVSWTLAGDTGSSQTISSTNTATFAGGFGISTVASATDTLTTAIDITGTDNAIAGLTAATPVATDTLWFNDISDSNTIRKATIASIVDLGNETLAQVLVNGNTTGGTDIAVSANDDITFTDTSKALFGDSNDLQIYHDGSNSFIKDAGTGDLVILSDTVSINNAANSENIAKFLADSAVKLYYDNVQKFQTTSTGINVTGAIGIGGVTIIDTTATYTQIRNPEVSRCIFLGDSADPSNYYDNTSHIFRSAAGAANYLTINGSLATFEDDVRIKGNLTVDGHIIHGGGGGGTGKGGQFTKLYTTGNAGVAGVAFTISRATTGVMIFDVMLTSDTSTACAVAKKYTVVKSYGASPLYNKILDTGPDFDTSDFNVVFAQDTTDFSIKCTITPVYTNTQKIGITLDLGFGQHDATVVMN